MTRDEALAHAAAAIVAATVVRAGPTLAAGQLDDLVDQVAGDGLDEGVHGGRLVGPEGREAPGRRGRRPTRAGALNWTIEAILHDTPGCGPLTHLGEVHGSGHRTR